MQKHRFVWFGVLLLASRLTGQSTLSASAYRVLGQSDLRLNGLNRVQGAELNSPICLAIDSREGFVRLYVADTRNHRILAWEDIRAYQTGDPPALVLGQASPLRSQPLGIGSAGLNSPSGLAVDPLTGNLYVADTGNHRILRFPAPFANFRRVEPDMVYGQPDLDSRTANTNGLSGSSLSGPTGVAVDNGGNLWIADTGNHRVLRYSAALLDVPGAEASIVVGQSDTRSGLANRGALTPSSGTLSRPSGLAFDREGNLYVADPGNARVLRFQGPVGVNATATGVFGQLDFTTGLPAVSPSASTLTSSFGLAVSSTGLLYVASPQENRVLVFTASAARGAPANSVLGQSVFTSITANEGVSPQASANTLSSPSDVKTDAQGNVYVADFGNNRVLMFPPNGRSSAQVWGQLDFASNGANQVKAAGLNEPYKAAIDYSQAPYPLYIADATNNRILAWRDSVRFRSGDPADFVIGQPDFRSGVPNADFPGGRRPTQTSLSSPRGIATDSGGNLYVADTANNRVLRFPRPVDQSGRVRADAVFGQADFTSSLSAAVSASTLRRPASVAIGPFGNLFVADNGNNRVVEYPQGSESGASANRVYGQPDFFSSTAHTAVSAQTLNAPSGLVLDGSHNLYVADTGANRVVVYPNIQDAPPAGTAALIVIGNDRFDTVAPAVAASARRLNGPVDVALSSAGTIYVSDRGNNRVLAFPSLLHIAIADAAADAVIGQRDFIGVARNWNTQDGQASAEGLSSPLGIYVDRRDTLYIADGGNSRVLHHLRAVTVTHAANAQASALPRGGLVTMEGAGLTGDEAASEPPFPYALANREVVVNDEIRAPMSNASFGQISLQLPSNAPIGSQRIAVRMADTHELIAGRTISVTIYSPGLFTRVTNQDGTVNSSSNPATRGTVVRLTGTGQGAVTPSVPDAEGAPESVNTVAVPTSDGGACLASQPSLCVSIGPVFGEIQFSGLAPRQVGVWQLDVRIPPPTPTGGQLLRAIINGQPSNQLTIFIR